ncbi:metallocarboxypeptidase, peptidase M14_like superfamily [Psychroflexus torquis ATCC 700755]|uniref:Metallocarboxypeptidase, peptidase M14_like superfamily n=1 Tax=Psychroflexus torquis (strain ATCC 700755 / CIP 106069 / ACAM 623) TaxID=313595 RepID=K4ITH7_PSYTT|nr:M14 family metallopeptidase [Psychroflexus torquis]AFU68785.1 metallocarboxypeptidase, peptidase M14_like superfamily [Psychroflexus torquis ATCC 700755]
MKTIDYTSVLCLIIAMTVGSVSKAQEKFFRAIGTPHEPKVEVSWNRYNTYDGVVDIMEKIAEAYPKLARLESIGKSYEDRSIYMLTISDFNTGNPDEKPAMYIDGNIHSNEIQGTEFSLYTAWYLTEMFGDLEFINQLLKDKTFYIVPTINPDARDNYMKEPNTPHSPRSGMLVLDNDGDGEAGEDGFDDLNGDNHITYMIRKSPTGRFIKDPQDQRRLIRVAAEEQGEYEMLGFEGIDKDGDGEVNEDGIGYYDPNRDWGWKWQPDHVQRGAYKYPFSLPESRAVADFVMKHPNIAGAQSYHNYGGMILRGPGAEEDVDTYNKEDVRIYDAIAKKGEEMIPGYRYLTVYKDLYSVFGGELDWFYGGRGIYTYTNELMVSYLYFHKNEGRANQEEELKVDKYLTFGDAFIDWKEYSHPQYGAIEVGGFKKNFSRAHPGFLLEQDAHRNMAFTIYHAYQTPKLSITNVEENNLGNGLKEVTATLYNERLMPTHSGQDLKFKIERPDLVSITNADVVAGMIVEDDDFNKVKEQVHSPETIKVPNIPGMETVKVRWIISGGRNYKINVDSAKGGKASWSK